MPDNSPAIASWIPVIAALVGGGGVSAVAALLTYRLNARKAAVEIEKLNLDIQKLKKEVDYKLSSSKEVIIYDSMGGLDGFQFDIRASAIDNSPVAKGKFSFVDGSIINIERTNREGRFEIRLTQYNSKQGQATCVMKDITVAS